MCFALQQRQQQQPLVTTNKCCLFAKKLLVRNPENITYQLKVRLVSQKRTLITATKNILY